MQDLHFNFFALNCMKKFFNLFLNHDIKMMYHHDIMIQKNLTDCSNLYKTELQNILNKDSTYKEMWVSITSVSVKVYKICEGFSPVLLCLFIAFLLLFFGGCCCVSLLSFV